jgi:hypothetical protein
MSSHSRQFPELFKHPVYFRRKDRTSGCFKGISLIACGISEEKGEENAVYRSSRNFRNMTW